MSYVPIYQSVLTHRKTLKFARLLNLDKFSVVGRLIALWTWCMDNAADGSLADIEPDILADVYAWDGKPSELVEALLSAGFLEIDASDHWRIHDWDQYVAARSSNAKWPTPPACAQSAANPASRPQPSSPHRVRSLCAAQTQHVRRMCASR
jgi:hypothetical protein